MKNAVIVSPKTSLNVQLRLAVARSEVKVELTELGFTEYEIQLAKQEIAGADIVIVALPDSVEAASELIQTLRRMTAARVVAVGTVETPQQLLSYIHSGANDFIDENDELSVRIAESVARATETKQANNSRTSPLITVVGAFGGAGATLTSANLSILLARHFESCGLIDLTCGYGDLVNHLDLRPRYSINELCSNVEELDLEMFNNALTEHPTGVNVLAAGTAVDRFSTPDSDAVKCVVELARSTLPCVITDLNRHARFATDVIHASDVVILLTGLNYSSAYATRRLLADWARDGIDSEKVLLVANRCRRRFELSVKDTAVILGAGIDLFVNDDAATANVAVNCGRPAVIESPDSELSEDMQNLYRTTIQALDGCAPSETQSNPRLLSACLSSLTKLALATFSLVSSK